MDPENAAPRCFRCKRLDHIARNCPRNNNRVTNIVNGDSVKTGSKRVKIAPPAQKEPFSTEAIVPPNEINTLTSVSSTADGFQGSLPTQTSLNLPQTSVGLSNVLKNKENQPQNVLTVVNNKTNSENSSVSNQNTSISTDWADQVKQEKQDLLALKNNKLKMRKY